MSDNPDIVGEPPQTALLALEQLISGERSITEFRNELLNTIYAQPQTVEALRVMIDEYSRRGLIPEQIQRLLIRDIDKTTTEELPTTPTEFTFSADSGRVATEETVHIDESTRGHVELPATERATTGLEIGDLLRDRFEIVGRASGGSMGVVYKAIDRRLAEAEGGQPYVAIKVLAPDFSGHSGAMRALQQEATKGRYLNHPNIVRFLDLDRSGDEVFLVMEWLEGRPLSAILNERPGQPFEPAVSWKIIKALGDALQHAHDLGVTHADVKPGNVMIQSDGTTKLLDFGIARARGDLAKKTVSPDPKIMNAATPAYASPQVLSGNAAQPVDDVFSLACLAYRLLSGRRVFLDKSALDARKKGLVPQRIETIGFRQWSGLSKALTLNASDRTPSIAALLHDLRIDDDPDNYQKQPIGVILFCSILLILLTVVAVKTVQGPKDPGSPVMALRIDKPVQVLPGSLSVMVDDVVEKPDDVVASDAALMASDAPKPSNALEERQTVDYGEEGLPPLNAEIAPARPDDRVDAVIEASVPVAAITDDLSTVDNQPLENLERAETRLASLILPSPGAVVPAPQLDVSVREDGEPISIVLRRNGNAAERPLTIVRQIADGPTRLALGDRVQLTPSSGVNFVVGNTETTIDVAIANNDHIEGELQDRYSIVDPENQAVVARLVLNIADDDVATVTENIPLDAVSFSLAQLDVNELDASVGLNIWRLNPSDDVLEVNLRVYAGSAEADEDFVFPSNQSIRFDRGEDRVLLLIPLVVDNQPEDIEQFRLELVRQEVVTGLHTTLTVRILDDTEPTLEN
ncbi:MAG: protein kinase [Woeseiaceae bacterium]